MVGNPKPNARVARVERRNGARRVGHVEVELMRLGNDEDERRRVALVHVVPFQPHRAREGADAAAFLPQPVLSHLAPR